MSTAIKARQLREGQFLLLGNHSFYVDSVEGTRFGEILVRIGFDGTGTEIFEPSDTVFVTNSQ